MLNRFTILHTAHDWARQAIRQNSYRHAHARRWPSYRAALADALRSAWAAARADAARAAADAVLAAEEAATYIPLPDDVARQVSGIRFEAECQTLTSYGNRRRRELLAEADDLAAAARCAIITNGDTHRHAHAR